MTQQQSRFLPAKIPSLILATSRPEPTAARAALRIFTIDEKMNVHYKMNVLFISFPGGKALMCQKADVI